MKALVTGFDPFGGDEVNPSSLAVGKLKKRVGSLAVHTVELPTSYARSAEVLRAAIAKTKPDIVLCVGQAGGRTELCLERVAINIQDARIRDNDGKQPIDKPVVADGPAAHFTTLPIKACVAAMRKAGLPAAVSNTAGTFVCNHIFYALMDIAASHPARCVVVSCTYPTCRSRRLGSAVRRPCRSVTSCEVSKSSSKSAPAGRAISIRQRVVSPDPRSYSAAIASVAGVCCAGAVSVADGFFTLNQAA